MGAAEKIDWISPDDYLEIESKALEKHEYVNGVIYAMSGASIAHNEIASNLMYSLKSKLKGKSCKPYGSDLRIHVPINEVYTYPDISVICGGIEKISGKFDNVTNPIVLIEILSPTTKDYDRGTKFSLYRGISSLREYLTIDSETLSVELYSINSEGKWELTEYKNTESIICISCLGIDLNFKEIYEDVFNL